MGDQHSKYSWMHEWIKMGIRRGKIRPVKRKNSETIEYVERGYFENYIGEKCRKITNYNDGYEGNNCEYWNYSQLLDRSQRIRGSRGRKNHPEIADRRISKTD